LQAKFSSGTISRKGRLFRRRSGGPDDLGQYLMIAVATKSGSGGLPVSHRLGSPHCLFAAKSTGTA
jgi:hypothetical protein